MGIIQAIAMAANIARMIADLSRQAQGANGSKLQEILNGIAALTDQSLAMTALVQSLIEAQRDELTDEEKQAVVDADNSARDTQRRVLGAMNDESGDVQEQARRRTSAREEAREKAKEAPEFSAARKAAEERGRSR